MYKVIAEPKVNKPTWQMKASDLARVFARHFGYTRHGNVIIDQHGNNVAMGIEHLATKLAAKGYIEEGRGVHWLRAGHNPRIARLSRDAHGYWN